jgi:hypothetical protein
LGHKAKVRKYAARFAVCFIDGAAFLCAASPAIAAFSKPSQVANLDCGDMIGLPFEPLADKSLIHANHQLRELLTIRTDQLNTAKS